MSNSLGPPGSTGRRPYRACAISDRVRRAAGRLAPAAADVTASRRRERMALLLVAHQLWTPSRTRRFVGGVAHDGYGYFSPDHYKLGGQTALRVDLTAPSNVSHLRLMADVNAPHGCDAAR